MTLSNVVWITVPAVLWLTFWWILSLLLQRRRLSGYNQGLEECYQIMFVLSGLMEIRLIEMKDTHPAFLQSEVRLMFALFLVRGFFGLKMIRNAIPPYIPLEEGGESTKGHK